MKLLRYGPPGNEQPGLLEGQGRIRDLSAHCPACIDGLGEQRQVVLSWQRSTEAGL